MRWLGVGRKLGLCCGVPGACRLIHDERLGIAPLAEVAANGRAIPGGRARHRVEEGLLVLRRRVCGQAHLDSPGPDPAGLCPQHRFVVAAGRVVVADGHAIPGRPAGNRAGGPILGVPRGVRRQFRPHTFAPDAVGLFEHQSPKVVVGVVTNRGAIPSRGAGDVLEPDDNRPVPAGCGRAREASLDSRQPLSVPLAQRQPVESPGAIFVAADGTAVPRRRTGDVVDLCVLLRSLSGVRRQERADAAPPVRLPVRRRGVRSRREQQGDDSDETEDCGAAHQPPP